MAIESPTLRNSQSTYFTAFIFVYLNGNKVTAAVSRPAEK